VVTVSWKSAVIWDLDRLRPLRTVVHDRSYIRDACLAADGDSLWTIDSASRLYLWNAHTGEKLNEASVQLPADTAGVFELRSVQFVAGGRVLLCAYDSRKAFGDDWKRGLEEATAIVARWRLPEIRLDRTFEIDAHWLNAMAAGADGTVAVVPGGKDGTIALWNVDSGKRLKVFTGYTSKYATKSPSAIELDTVHDSLSAAINQSVVSWDLTTGEILHQVNGHEPLVNGLRMSADGRFVASTAAGGVRVAEPRRRQLVRTLRQARASAVEFVPDSSLLLSGERDETLILWNLDTPVAPQAITHDKAIRGLVAGDHDTMFSACEDRLVRWSATSPAQLLVAFEELVKGEKQTGDLVIDAAGRFAQGEPTTEAGNFSLGLWSQVRDCVVDREGKTALLGLTSGTTMHLNLQDGATRRLPSLDSPVVNCAFVDDSIAMSAGLNGTVQLYNLRRRRVTWTFDLGIKLRSAAVTRAASRAIFGGDDGEIVVIDLHARAIVMAIDYRIDDFARFQYRGTMNWQQAPTSVSISADGRRGLAAFILPGLVLLDVDSHAVRVLGTPHGSVGCASLSEDGRHALSGGLNGQLAFWDIDGGAPIASVIVDEEITAVTIAGNRFATGDASGRVCLGVIDGHLTSPFEPPADRGFSTSHEERDWCISPRPHRLRKPSPRGGKASSPRRRRVR
jgi:WD40 repeat protein